ncbi:MAG: hypothetical protein P8J32_01905 [bacterium]|nr:hypothetical protein [bacterium]
MKAKIATLLTALFLAAGLQTKAQDTLGVEQRGSIISQIEKSLHIPFELNEDIKQGYARVGILLTDSSTVHITGINSETHVIQSYLEMDLEGMKINAREEDLGKTMAFIILFDRR